MSKVLTAEEYMNIPTTTPGRVAIGLNLPEGEFKKLSTDAKAEIFAEKLSTRPIEEQIAASTITKNVLNGCCWEFVRSNPDIRRNLEAFKKSKVCSVQKVVYDHKQNVFGYLVFMQMQHLCSILSETNKGPLNAMDLDRASKHRMKAKNTLLEKMKAGFKGRIGIFCTNDSQTITVEGKTFPAYAVTLLELCALCSSVGYGIDIGGVIRDPVQIVKKEDAVIESLTVAPSSNALFINIAPLR